MGSLRSVWSRSKLFRILLVIAFTIAVLRLAAQVYLSVERMLPGQSETQIIPNDLQDYLDAATRLAQRLPLYPVTSDYGKYYQYPPVFALVMQPFLALPPGLDYLLNFILRLAGYALLYFCWGRIFQRARLEKALDCWAWTLPIWLVFSAFWSDLTYMNIYILSALFFTLLVDAVMAENLLLSLLWLTVLLQTKPFWAIAALLPLLLGRYKFFIRIFLAGLVVNAFLVGAFLLMVGPAYGWQQHVGFIQFLAALDRNFPWRLAASGFLGYNHSILQVAIFLLGNSSATFRLAVVIKIVLLLPLVVLCVRSFLHPARRAGYEAPELALGLAFALYLGVYIWLDMVWEVSLGCAIFVFLLAQFDAQKVTRALLWLVFLPYVLIDLWQIGSYAILGDSIFLPGGEYIRTDYSMYIPIVMIVVLVFYGLILVKIGLTNPEAAQTGRLEHHSPTPVT